MKIHRLTYLSLAVLFCAPGLSATTTPAGGSSQQAASPWRISTHFRVQTLGVEPSQRLEREVIQVMESWHHLFLVAFEAEPQDPIPVLLHARQTFHRNTGAPSWANGVYTSKGTIHAAIGGVARVEADLERRLAHELAHAFITGLSAGEAPRWLQEGLAQALSDLRPATDLAGESVTAGTLAELDYRGTLAFARHLLALYGQAAMRDSLAAMGSGEDVADAFRAYTGASATEQFHRWRGKIESMARQRDGENPQ